MTDEQAAENRHRLAVLLVEDNPGDARLVRGQLGEIGGHGVTWVTTLAEACTRLHDEALPDAVLLDLSLPDSHGLESVRAVRDAAPGVPVVVLTGLDDERTGVQAVREGCQDYLVKGSEDPALLRRTLAYAMERKEIERERQGMAAQLHRTLLQTVRAVSMTVEMRDPFTAGHQRRVAHLARRMGQRMGFDAHRLEGLETGALIHDLGKINVPAEFLARPGRLSGAAFEVIKAHPRVGHDIVAPIEFPWPIATMILQHHEHLDGSGYPDGLAGEAIIPESRILAVADVVEAISAHRPYRPSLGLEAAMEEVAKGAGTAYDTDAVAACQAEIAEHGRDAFAGDIPGEAEDAARATGFADAVWPMDT